MTDRPVELSAPRDESPRAPVAQRSRVEGRDGLRLARRVHRVALVSRPHLALTLLLVVACTPVIGCQSSGGRPVQASVEMPPDRLDLASGPGPMLGALTPAEPNATVEAVVTPPAGWRAEPLKSSARHKHQVWLSPSGNTAYGVIRFKMPLPAGADAALRFGVLPEMRRTEGEARLISSDRDPSLPGLRFVAEGGKYRLRSNLITRGWRGWVIYAGTLRASEIVTDELALAELAREHTAVGLPR